MHELDDEDSGIWLLGRVESVSLKGLAARWPTWRPHRAAGFIGRVLVGSCEEPVQLGEGQRRWMDPLLHPPKLPA